MEPEVEPVLSDLAAEAWASVYFDIAAKLEAEEQAKPVAEDKKEDAA